jgi:hypothetical protein
MADGSIHATPRGCEMMAPRHTHRSTVLYSLEPSEGALGPPKPRLGDPVADLFVGAELDLYRRWYAEGDAQLPRIRHSRGWAASDLHLKSAEAVIVPRAAHTWLFEMPAGGLIAGLTIDYLFADDPGALRPCPALFRDIDAGRYDLRLDGVPLLDVCLSDLEEHEPRPHWGADIHHLMFAAPGSLQPAQVLDRDFAQRLVSRRVDPSRAEFLTVRLPSEANRFPDFLCAVTPGASAVAGHPPEVELAFTLSAVMILAAVSSLRESQRQAFAALAELQAPHLNGPQATTGERRRLLKRRLEDLAELQLATSFGVEAYLDMRLLVPSMPVVEFHHDLVEALGIPRSAGVTERILTRLSQGIASEAEEIAADERLADERRWRTWSVVGGSIAATAVPLSLIFGFLGINAADVKSHDSIGDLGHYAPYYTVIVGAIALSVLIGLLYVSLHYRRQRE